MKLKGKKIAILVEKIYEDLEAWYPYLRFKEEGADVKFIGPEKGKIYESKHGYALKSDMSIQNAKAEDFDGVIIPGGYSPDHMRRTPRFAGFVKEMHEQGKTVAAICHGGWILASAGIIDDKKVTGFYSIKDDLENAGATFVDEEVVHDNGIITSRNPFDLPVFCRTIIGALALEPIGIG